MKRLVVCCDGTWNTPDQEENGIPAPTNVFKLHNAVAETGVRVDPAREAGARVTPGIPQLTYYHPGVGTEGGWFKRLMGGAVGAGVSRHICSAYHWLGRHYAPGDEIFLFGFSRGAFTVRSLGGFLGRGLLDLRGLAPAAAWERVHTAYDQGYRTTGSKPGDWVKTGWTFFHQAREKEPLPAPIRFIGVWDTVGSLGVPNNSALLNLLDRPSRWRFHDTTLGGHVQTARHAMALDEVRASFTVTRWANAGAGRDIRELWFPGVHSDVGGGYADCCLPNGALRWMMREAARAGLRFRPGVAGTIRPDPLGPMHNSCKGAFAKLRSRPRNIPAVAPGNPPLFHPAVLKRQAASPIAYPPYHPTRSLDLNQSATVEVFADTRWNATGIYMHEDEGYTFAAQGEWKDSRTACDWRGIPGRVLSMGNLLRGFADVAAELEAIYRALTDNRDADFYGTRRVEKFPWFALVGAVTNDGGAKEAVAHDGSPSLHQCAMLADYTQEALLVKKPGYFFCFANDAWSFYKNNRGSLLLTVTRVK